MAYNFDEVVNRENTNSIKYDFAEENDKPKDILPLWLADMDFRAPDEVIDALVHASKHGIFGYTDIKEDYFKAVNHWYDSNFDWKTKRLWLVLTPGVVYAISMAIRTLTDENDSVMVQMPIYHPIFKTIEQNNRKLVNSSLHFENGKYTIDFNDFEQKIIDHKVKLFVLCSPHNPVGRVWTKEELTRIGDICLKYNVFVVSDEIHSDFVYGENHHTVFASIKPEFSEISVTCTAPMKTFNLAGLQVANIFIENKKICKAFQDECIKNGYINLNVMGLVACMAAYTYGRKWLDELISYLEGNLNFLIEYIRTKIPQIKVVEPEGTYLVWLDFRTFGLSEAKLEDLIVNGAKLWLNCGSVFGEGGQGFQRINIACPRSVLEKALIQLETAVKDMESQSK